MDLSDLVDAALEVSVVGSFTDVGLKVRRHLDGWSDAAPDSLAGRSVMVTGTTSGIGRATALACARLGATVHTVGRDRDRTEAAARAIADAAGGATVLAWTADLADLDAVRSLADRFVAAGHPLDSLVHNAGALLAERTVTPQGHETTFAAMVLGPALLTERLVPLLATSATTVDPAVARVVLVSSGGMYAQRLEVDDPESRTGYRGTVAYARAKRAQVVLADRWAQRWAADRIVVHACHPGWAATPGVHTALPRFERLVGPWLRTPEEGADTVVWLLTAPEAARTSGRFWHDRRARSVHRLPGTRERPGDVERLEALVRDAIGV